MIYELKEELRIEYWKLAKKKLTKNQYKTMRLLSTGLTQSEVATEMGITQTSVQKCLKGNSVYPDGVKLNYGGIILKLRTAAAKDQTIQKLLKRINDLTS